MFLYKGQPALVGPLPQREYNRQRHINYLTLKILTILSLKFVYDTVFLKLLYKKQFLSCISSGNRILRLVPKGLHHIRVMEKLEYLKLEHLPGIVYG